ncbi:MAG: ATP-binding protein [Candidatus Rokuibacteriota bacterium]
MTSRVRFSGLALLAIVVPATILAALGYISLRQWESSSEILFREQAREMAAMAAGKLEMVMRQTDEKLLSGLQSVIADPETSERALEAWVANAPLIQELCLLDRHGQLLYPEGPKRKDSRVVAALQAEIPDGFWERGGHRDVIVGGRVVLAAILRLRDGRPVLAGLVRNIETVRREVLEKALGGLGAPTIVAVIDHEDRPLYSVAPLDRAHRVVTVPLPEGLSNWRVALYQPAGTSPRESVRRQVAIFTGALGLLLVVIVAGIVATFRVLRRESEMARLKSDFVANVSHDLKTPLSVIRMFGETLEMGRVTDQVTRQEYYRVITRESERLSRLIDNVLDFSRIEGGRRRYDMVPTVVEPLVRETIEAFSYPMTQHGFKVEVHVAPDLPEVAMDADAVAQALGNLVDNAIKYSGERKSITIDARTDGEGLALSVADEGIGIPREEQGRIFEKFYRVGRSETQGRRGSGVGLALVRHVAEAHGGRVTVESRPGDGSRFTLHLPLR